MSGAVVSLTAPFNEYCILCCTSHLTRVPVTDNLQILRDFTENNTKKTQKKNKCLCNKI